MTDQDFTVTTPTPVVRENALKYADIVLSRIESIHELNAHLEGYSDGVNIEETRSHLLYYVEGLTKELRLALNTARGL